MRIVEQYSKGDPEILTIVEARYIGDFAIRIFFSDGTKKLVDFRPFLEQSLHPSIKKYLNENLFSEFEIRDGNLDWNDFDMIFPIADLYQNTILHQEGKLAY